MSSYAAVVTKITVRPHPNADRLQLGTCLGNQVVVGLDTKDGELGVFFPTDGQLSHEFCDVNWLYSESACLKLGTPVTGRLSFGFFDVRRRVRAQRFRGERSDGFWVPLTYLQHWSDPSTLKEGDTFTEWGGVQICQKYYTPATLRALGQQQPRKREVKCFPKHEDTQQFRFMVDVIPTDSVIYITEKLHGTSGRYGHVYDEVEDTTLWARILRFLVGKRTYDKGWFYLNGSRNVILERTTGEGYYGTNSFRYDVVNNISLHKGEVLFFEIVGYVQGNQPIMPPQDIAATKLYDVQKQYGDKMHYTYGCPEGTHRMYVYKIAMVNVDGVVNELSWLDMVRRCGELGLAHVPLLRGPLAYTGNEPLRQLVEELTEGPSTLSPTQIREGVVVRVESKVGTTHIKNKQWAFGVLEGFWKEKEDNVDPEDVA